MSEPITARITEQIRSIRQARGITRDELAALARAAGAPDSFTTAALRNLEIGRRAATVDELVWLATGLRVPARQLLGEHAGLFGADDKPDPDRGEVESAARRFVQDLAELDGHQLTLAESAYALARALDGDAGMAAAAMARELRATLKEIRDRLPIDDDDDDDDLGPS